MNQADKDFVKYLEHDTESRCQGELYVFIERLISIINELEKKVEGHDAD